MGSIYNIEKGNLLHAAGFTNQGGRVGVQEELRATPLFSLLNKYSDIELVDAGIFKEKTFKHYSMLGIHDGAHDSISENEPILQNTRTPFSTFICGSQGSGKSYTLNCMLENWLHPSTSHGSPGPRQAGLVLHYRSGSSSEPSETAGICRIGVPVRVYVAPTNYTILSQKYHSVLGPSTHLTVSPLFFKRSQLTLDMLRRMMAIRDGTGNRPLYMYIIQKILRDIAMEDQGRPFDYGKFRARVDGNMYLRSHSGVLDQRLALLDGFLQPPSQSNYPGVFEDLAAGTLTIIDLSCPFIDTANVRVLFDICIDLFKSSRISTGLVIALDEAHRFLGGNLDAATNNLTDQLVATIREQRHNGVRVIIATQDPPPVNMLLDLCSITIVHRFTSPAWYSTIARRLIGASRSSNEQAELMGHIADLHVGQCLVFSPSSFVCTSADNGMPKKLGDTCFRLRVRRRLGLDLGVSKLADVSVQARPHVQPNGVLDPAAIAAAKIQALKRRP